MEMLIVVDGGQSDDAIRFFPGNDCTHMPLKGLEFVLSHGVVFV